ncbi:MAG: RsbRD N-terminal domain-containing protein, partial [Chloroflexi bacterium]|nr:RsbRD N-terminal domain-containing protein [Chloroflexota bacterium]
MPDHATPDVETRIEHLAHGTDLRPVADILVRERTSIVGGWLQLAARQPFHADRPERAVADHIPVLVDAIASVLARNASPNDDVEAPLEDAAVAGAATAHAQVRFEQGLGPVAIATEFRLLRQEISRVLVAHLEDELPTTDVVKSVMVVNDALDGATMLALAALTDRIEQVRDEFLATTLHDVRQPIT